MTATGTGRRRAAGQSLPSAPVLVGAGALLLAMVLSIAAPPTALSAVLGAVAVIGLAREPRLGLLPAALLALIAVPYGRAADNDLASIAGIPLRFQDGVVATALVLALPSLRHAELRRGISRLIAAFLVVGLVALVIGIVEGNAARDILRDARWWGLYGFGLLALWGGVDRRKVVRGLIIGGTLFAAVLVAVVLLPPFAGGLETRALTYDWGRLRLQFSNSIFLIPALAYLAARIVVRPTPRDAGWLFLLATAIVLSVTRMSIVAGLGTLGLTFVWMVWRHRQSLTVGRVVTSGALVGVILAASFGGALGLVAAGATVAAPPGGGTADRNDEGEIFDRILFQDPASSVEAIERGRFATYRAALEVIDDAPIVGLGLGTLVPIDFTFGGSEPSTPGMQPGVDDAYLTVAMKSGVVGAVVFAAMMAWPLLAIIRRPRDRLAWWFLPGWLGILGLSLTQSFATSGYGAFGLALLLVLIELRRPRAPTPAV